MPVALKHVAGRFDGNTPIVNRAHPLGRNLDFAVAQQLQGGHMMDLANGISSFPGSQGYSESGTASPFPSEHGSNWAGGVRGKNGPVVFPDAWPYHQPPNQFPFALGFLWQIYGGTLGSQDVYNCGKSQLSGNQSGIRVTLQGSSNRFAFAIGDGTGTATTDVKQWQVPYTFINGVTSGTSDQGSFLWVFRSLTDVSAYLNGIDVSSTFTFTGTGTVWGEVGNPVEPAIGCVAQVGGSPGQIWGANVCPLVCKWSDNLSDQDAMNFHANPFEMFSTRPRIIKLPPPPQNYTDSATLAVKSVPGGIEGLTPQDGYPISDVSAGSWTASGGGTLWDKIDEEPISDTDYIQSDAAH